MRLITILIVFALFVSCGKSNSEAFEFLYQVKLDKKLKEISGLALSESGELFAHDDEMGVIYRLDTNTGKILEEIKLEPQIKGDFEGIAVVKNVFYMLRSDGVLFKVFKNGVEFNYTEIKTGLKQKNDVEGLCYLEKENTLLLACKEKSGLKEKHIRTIFKYNLETQKLISDEPVKLNIKELKGLTNRSNFNPSGIEYCKLNKSLYVLDGKNISIAIINKNGTLKNAFPLDKDLHKQPEGITFKNDLLIIADEGKHGKATLTFYRLL